MKYNGMKNKRYISQFVFALLSTCMLFITSCSEGGLMGGSNLGGKSGELLIVINDEYKNSQTSETVTEIMNQYEIGLTQSEAPFSILMISRNHFSSVFRSHRNILFIDINKKFTSPLVQFKKNVWTKQQNYIGVGVESPEKLLEILKLRHDNIIDFFVQAEIERFKLAYHSMPGNKVRTLVQQHLNIRLDIPEGYEINKQAPGFMWISFESNEHSQGLLIYERAYRDTMQLEKWKLLQYRDSITKAYIPGPSKGSYMTTEYIVPIQYKVGRYVNNDYTVELRGKWRVEHDFMGGPFVSYSFVDNSKKRLVTIEGYVYYPNKSKRNFVRQLQAICQSVRFVEGAK